MYLFRIIVTLCSFKCTRMNADKKVAFYTLGCKLNFSETSTIARNFVKEGFNRVDFNEKADVYVINTCSVTDNADKRFKSIVKNALKKNKEAFLIAVGCYAQLKPEELAAVDGVDLVLGSKEKFKILDYLNDLNKNNLAEVYSCEISETDFYKSSYSIGERTRSFLKVQDGCDYKCTYCTIPLARGISRSDKLSNIISSAQTISRSGVKEIVLTGVNIGDYGKGEFGDKKHKNTFLELISELDKDKNETQKKVSLMTIHLAKGLEFSHVYIVGLEEDLFPSALSSTTRSDLEEERRLFYVALTRAEKEAYLSYALSRYRWGKLTDSEPSRFIDEINEEYLEILTPINENKFNTLIRSTPNNEPSFNKLRFKKLTTKPKGNFKKIQETSNKSNLFDNKLVVGNVVEHIRFGKGEVVNIEGRGADVKAEIKFENGGLKKLLLRFAKLKIIA